TYKEALEEKVLRKKTVQDNIITLTKGSKINYEFLKELLFNHNFNKVDFVNVPGEFALRGSIIDIFSYSDNIPYRIDFFGDSIESIAKFDPNSQRTVEEIERADIYPNLSAFDSKEFVDFKDILPGDTFFWDKENLKDADVIPQPTFNKNFEILYQDIYSKQSEGYAISILSPNPNQSFRLQQILRSIDEVNPIVLPDFLSISLHEGYVDKKNKRCYYTDHQIFERYHKVQVKREVNRSEQLTLNDLLAFRIGDYIVHIDHGIGQFGGLVKTRINGQMQEAIKLIYKGGDEIFVSIHGIHRISKYKSREGEAPKVNKLGSKTWEALKHKTKAKVKDIAQDLIKLYSERMATKGFAFSPDNYLQQELESSFMFEDTPDQQKATVDVKADMEDIHPMDRLICGDVGFGKTEIAIRAAFRAVCDNKQVAVLVPTTILALQHFQTFSARLHDFPCSIEYISRLKSAKEISQIIERVKEGKVDILIGTHRILNKELEFKDLGLLIIDEEQKFGVTAKERLRQLKANVDTLTLTATPIPRTLQFSLLGARDLSIINTPPPNRLPVYTEIIDFNEDTIREVINNEIERGGQVFFIHNRVEDIASVKDILQRICPKAKICVAHGQMAPKELEERIMDFMDGDYDVLLSTTIIENGIDIPNANTMIINSAQNFGLSDLHQLRGRVGRSNVKAYCYLIVPSMKSITDDARRRLNAIETFSDLGSGFNIAMQDLDIRGAGNLLGAEQSGFIADMGFEVYQKILNEALVELRTEAGMTAPSREQEEISDCYIDTDITAVIPDSYLDIQAEKIRIYKELDNIKSNDKIDRFTAEMEDRFGPIPKEFEELINIVRMRIVALKLGIEKIILKNGIMLCYFVSNQMSPFYKGATFGHIINFIQKSSRNYQMIEQNNKLYIKCKGVNSIEKALVLLQEMLPLSVTKTL
ncbi:MAG: transcription-repair coupling factor, partial [Bacteroidales bacterium]|nr:transcription-repair coupling factor [Bacteroidales bacterium]